jgi:hypothetical protein
LGLDSIWIHANHFLPKTQTAVNSIPVLLESFIYEAYKCYFGQFTQASHQETGKHFFSCFFKNLQINYFTLDIDSTILTRYGNQEGSKVGYNPQKRGRESHHPIIAFVNEVRLVAHFWIRSGDSSSANYFVSFLEETLSSFGDKKVGLIRF